MIAKYLLYQTNNNKPLNHFFCMKAKKKKQEKYDCKVFITSDQ